MTLPNPLCQNGVDGQGEQQWAQCLAFKTHLLSCTESSTFPFPPVKTVWRDLFYYLLVDLWSQIAFSSACWPWAVHFSLLPSPCSPPLITGAAVLHVVPKPWSQQESLFSLVKTFLLLSFFRSFVSPIYPCPLYLALIFLHLFSSRSVP